MLMDKNGLDDDEDEDGDDDGHGQLKGCQSEGLSNRGPLLATAADH